MEKETVIKLIITLTINIYGDAPLEEILMRWKVWKIIILVKNKSFAIDRGGEVLGEMVHW